MSSTVTISEVSVKDRIVSFVWQHVLLLGTLFIIALGVALCVRSNLGSSVISSTPLAFTMAGKQGAAPALSLGNYTNLLNVALVLGQIIILRRRFQAVQLLQLVIGLAFGLMIDLNMALTSAIDCPTLWSQCIVQIAGCSVMAFGVALEVRCGSVTMPGEGLPVAINRAFGLPFAKAKIIVDITLVVLAVASGYTFFGRWLWNVVGPGTLFAMIYVGMAVRAVSARCGWFDRLLYYRPGLRRYIYGLARYISGRH